jgi:hypothetical protein
LSASGERLVDLTNKDKVDFIRELKAQPTGRTFYYQPNIEGYIGQCPCSGRADLIQVTRGPDNSLNLLVVDIKASQRETVGYRLQVALYARLLQELLKESEFHIASIEGAVASRDTEFVPDKWRTFDLALFADEIERLVAAPDSDVARAACASFETATFQLGHHCDGCPYNALCFIDAAEREDLSLVPHITATEKRTLLAEGIKTTRDLAHLMQYGRREMEPASGREGDVTRLGQRWPLGSRLALLAQRARAALRRHDSSVEARRTLYGSDWGTLPDPNEYPDLIKVFIEASRDHLQDRLYMLAALIVGPSASIEVIEMTDAPPDTDSERSLLIAWIQRVLPAIRRAADSPEAPLHVYLFDRRGQRSLLDALARHFDALCAIPAFYDLLTSTPALTQSMISFLGDEVRERQNLAPICQNLYEVARAMNFKWQDESLDATKSFRSRVFDNVRPFERDVETGQFRVSEQRADQRGSPPVWVESAARFGTEIPLEYSYAAWGLLQETTGMGQGMRAQLRGFLGTEVAQIKQLASQRLRALRHIEESFRYKNRRVEKPALSLGELDQVEIEPEAIPLHRSLEDFLYLEHYAKMQELLLHLSLPPELRAETGHTAIMLCDAFEKRDNGEQNAIFTITDVNGTPLREYGAPLLRFKEGDWAVLNPLMDEDGAPLSGKRLVHGRLCIVESLDERQLRLRLHSMSFKKSEFRFGHRMLEPMTGAVYTLDEMADDFNADKFLEACRNASSNYLYRWLSDVGEGKKERQQIRPSRLRTGEKLAELADEAQSPRGLTTAQRNVIGGNFKDRILVLQGPPGTGKSHTLGFAAIARALAFSTPARPFRIAVAARTHAATEIALASIKRRAEHLKADSDDPLLSPLSRIRVMKIVNESGENLPASVEPLSADGSGNIKATEQWATLLEEPLLVVGGTPGGFYNLIKRGPSRGKSIDWTKKYFDLVIVDEASQMGIAEALMAAAFLREDGQFIAIGDHRQMPPILAHAWDQESRRDLERTRPHLSIFETLRETGYQSAALDESFRIPAEIAEFLNRHVYSEDGINFRSENRERLARLNGLEGWLEAAMTPEHPLVVIEHSETGSEQSNEFEASLVEEIVRAATVRLQLSAETGIGIVVPHRAQKYLLRERLPEIIDSIDTVERFQGGERDLIIVSATVSDREFARLESIFLLDPRRLTVAISRPKRKLIVIASSAVFDLIPGDLDEYERGSLWKYLRHECSGNTLWEGPIANHHITVRAMKRKDVS